MPSNVPNQTDREMIASRCYWHVQRCEDGKKFKRNPSWSIIRVIRWQRSVTFEWLNCMQSVEMKSGVNWINFRYRKWVCGALKCFKWGCELQNDDVYCCGAEELPLHLISQDDDVSWECEFHSTKSKSISEFQFYFHFSRRDMGLISFDRKIRNKWMAVSEESLKRSRIF